jgi:hypothetical protein
MAKKIRMRHPQLGLLKDGYYGFSWTTFFFGMFPALFRGDFSTFLFGFLVLFLIAIFTWPILGMGAPIAMFAWAFMYNKYYTRKLIQQGYVFDEDQQANREAGRVLGIVVP